MVPDWMIAEIKKREADLNATRERERQLDEVLPVPEDVEHAVNEVMEKIPKTIFTIDL